MVTNVMYQRRILGNGLISYDKLNGSIGKECHQHLTRGNGHPATASCPLHILLVLPMFLRCFISLAERNISLRSPYRAQTSLNFQAKLLSMALDLIPSREGAG
jgi:hypothetical protein